MNDDEVLHFPRSKPNDNNPHAAKAARERIAGLPDQYTRPAPPKEELVGAVAPISPATNPLATPPAAKSNEKAVEAPTGKPKPKRRLPSRLKPLLTGVVTFILLFMLFKSPIFLNQLGYLTQKPATPANKASATNVVSPESQMSIPKISVNTPVVYIPSNTEAAIQKGLEGGVVHYAGTATPGENGNVVIVGHSSNDWWEPGNYKFVFVLLDKLASGDTFTINYNSRQYLYQVTEVKVVEPTDVSVLAQTADPQVTLITCTPPGTSWKRLIIKSKQTSPAVNTQKKPITTNPTPNGKLPSNAPSFGERLSQWWQSLVAVFSKPTDKPAQSPGSTTIPSALPAE